MATKIPAPMTAPIPRAVKCPRAENPPEVAALGLRHRRDQTASWPSTHSSHALTVWCRVPNDVQAAAGTPVRRGVWRVPLGTDGWTDAHPADRPGKKPLRIPDFPPRGGLVTGRPLPRVAGGSILVTARPSGGMADALDSKSSAQRRVGSSPTLATSHFNSSIVPVILSDAATCSFADPFPC